MARFKIFIASSSEGLAVTKSIRGHLYHELGQKAEVNPWTRKFEYSANYIESLEKAVSESDFAIFVLTPDDLKEIRGEEIFAPRDNVIFELGLFMGCLGRNRCFIVKDEGSKIAVPSDLLGVKLATFQRLEDDNLDVALDHKCFLISESMEKVGIRYKLKSEERKAQAAALKFCHSVEGAWWQRSDINDDNSVVSLFYIRPDMRFNSVRLEGKSYDPKGDLSAYWKSVIVRIDIEDNKIIYVWKGGHKKLNSANVPFHGLGNMDFDRPLDSRKRIYNGNGKFWRVDEFYPERTILKTNNLRRVLEQSEIETMASGKSDEIRSLVLKIKNDF